MAATAPGEAGNRETEIEIGVDEEYGSGAPRSTMKLDHGTLGSHLLLSYPHGYFGHWPAWRFVGIHLCRRLRWIASMDGNDFV